MINIKDSKCIYPNYEVIPIFNFKSEKKGIYCVKHKSKNMLDVKDSKCIHPNCELRPNFNFKGNKTPIYCAKHKSENMINIIGRKCIHPTCETEPNYNLKGELTPIYCVKHKYQTMIDIRHPSCKNDWCNTQVTNKYEGYCFYCFVHMFPEKPIPRNYKTKERAVVEFVKTNFPQYDWTTDKTIPNACSKRRPDIFIDLGYQCIIIEIDENQHQLYDSTCENRRLMELSQDINHRPLVFIRFNPDDYKQNKTNITSCWANSKTGVSKIKKSKEKEWNTRLSTLKTTIKKWTNPEMKCSKTIEVEHLFYDR
jgi:hypothetical protein